MTRIMSDMDAYVCSTPYCCFEMDPERTGWPGLRGREVERRSAGGGRV
jgi:hypothetical protein